MPVYSMLKHMKFTPVWQANRMYNITYRFPAIHSIQPQLTILIWECLKCKWCRPENKQDVFCQPSHRYTITVRQQLSSLSSSSYSFNEKMVKCNWTIVEWKMKINEAACTTYVLTAGFPVICASWSPLSFFIHMFRNRTFGDKWYRFFTGQIPFSCHPTNSAKALKETQSTVHNQ